MQNEKLKIYTSREWMLADKLPVIMLYPYWGERILADTDPDKGRFDAWMMAGKDTFSLVDTLPESDIALYPCDLSADDEGLKHVAKAAQEAALQQKKLLVFFNSDIETTFGLNNVLLIRTSCQKNLQPPHVYGYPGWSLDFLRYFPGEKIAYHPYQKKPSVSYCGYVDGSSLKRLPSVFYSKQLTPEARRGKAVRTLKKNREIDTDFIIRKSFWAEEIPDRRKVRQEYAVNMIGSLYAIVARGGGNFSYRLYETLSCGRIPLFINTDCLLPFDDQIDWKQHTVWLEEKELSRIDQVLLDFHRQKSPSELEALQAANRKLYEEFISPVGYFKKLCQWLQQQAKNQYARETQNI
jgi:hypothetical protein